MKEENLEEIIERMVQACLDEYRLKYNDNTSDDFSDFDNDKSISFDNSNDER